MLNSSSFSSSSASSFHAAIRRSSEGGSRRLKIPAVTSTSFTSPITNAGDSKVDQMKEMFDKVELSASPYDTAWVAMVPSLVSPAPCFPDSVTWLLENQLKDGSWRLPSQIRPPLHMKDTLSSTLACLLALRRWGIGDQHIHNGKLDH